MSHPILPAQNGQLLDRRGPKRIPRAEHDLAARLVKVTCEFADRSGFAAAVDTNDEDDGGSRRGEMNPGRFLFQHGPRLGRDRFEHFLEVDHTGTQSFADIVANRLGGPDSHVGANQSREELIEELIVDEPAFALEQVADVGIEGLARLAQGPAHLRQQPPRASLAGARLGWFPPNRLGAGHLGLVTLVRLLGTPQGHRTDHNRLGERTGRLGNIEPQRAILTESCLLR